MKKLTGNDRNEPNWTKPFQVINLRTNASHGEYESLDEAKGAVLYDRLTDWEIWRNSTALVAHRDTGRF
jgi:hypothetical protein